MKNMCPAQLTMLLHYRTTPHDPELLHSVTSQQALHQFIAAGYMRPWSEEDSRRATNYRMQYALTDKGEAFVDHLLTQPEYPELTWRPPGLAQLWWRWR